MSVHGLWWLQRPERLTRGQTAGYNTHRVVVMASPFGVRHSCVRCPAAVLQQGQAQPLPLRDNKVIHLHIYDTLSSTGCFKLIAANSFSVQCPRRFWEIDPEIFAHTRVLYPPAERLTNFSFFWARYLCFCIFYDIWVMRDPTFPAEEKKKFANGSAAAYKIPVAKFQGISLKDGVDIWTFVR